MSQLRTRSTSTRSCQKFDVLREWRRRWQASEVWQFSVLVRSLGWSWEPSSCGRRNTPSLGYFVQPTLWRVPAPAHYFFYFLFIFLLQYFEFQEEARFSVKSGNMLVNKRWKTGIFWLMWKINIKFPRTLQKYQRRESEQEEKYYCWWVHLAHSPASLLLFTRKVAKLS